MRALKSVLVDLIASATSLIRTPFWQAFAKLQTNNSSSLPKRTKYSTTKEERSEGSETCGNLLKNLAIRLCQRSLLNDGGVITTLNTVSKMALQRGSACSDFAISGEINQSTTARPTFARKKLGSSER